MTSHGKVRLALLLPPSEGKAEGGRAPKWKAAAGTFGPALTAPRRELLAALAAAKGGDAKLLGVQGAHLARAQAANRALVGAPTLPAHERYTGVVWEHLAPSSMNKATMTRAIDSVVVFSGLLGLVGLADPVPDYRLKMGASLKPMGKVSTWWREPLTAAFDEWARKRVVIDLLPGEHRSAWTPSPDAYTDLVTVAFVEKSGKVAGHDAKAAKGLLARHLLESKGDPIVALKAWKHPRFRLSLS